MKVVIKDALNKVVDMTLERPPSGSVGLALTIRNHQDDLEETIILDQNDIQYLVKAVELFS